MNEYLPGLRREPLRWSPQEAGQTTSRVYEPLLPPPLADMHKLMPSLCHRRRLKKMRTSTTKTTTMPSWKTSQPLPHNFPCLLEYQARAWEAVTYSMRMEVNLFSSALALLLIPTLMKFMATRYFTFISPIIPLSLCSDNKFSAF